MRGFVLDPTTGPHMQNDLPIPAPKSGEALIRVHRAGICSTDIEMIRGYKDGFTGVLWHEFVGTVVRVCEGDESWTGKRITLFIEKDVQFPVIFNMKRFQL